MHTLQLTCSCLRRLQKCSHAAHAPLSLPRGRLLVAAKDSAVLAGQGAHGGAGHCWTCYTAGSHLLTAQLCRMHVHGLAWAPKATRHGYRPAFKPQRLLWRVHKRLAPHAATAQARMQAPNQPSPHAGTTLKWQHMGQPHALHQCASSPACKHASHPITIQPAARRANWAHCPGVK